MLMMHPAPVDFIAFMAVFVPMKTPSRLTAMTRFQSAKPSSAIGLAKATPAQLTRMSKWPHSALMVVSTASQSGSAVTSNRLEMT